MIKWQNNTILYGDCLKIMDKMEYQCVDVIITDPPYNYQTKIKYDQHAENYWLIKKQQDSNKRQHHNIKKRQNDLALNNLSKPLNWDKITKLWLKISRHINWFIFCNDNLLQDLLIFFKHFSTPVKFKNLSLLQALNKPFTTPLMFGLRILFIYLSKWHL